MATGALRTCAESPTGSGCRCRWSNTGPEAEPLAEPGGQLAVSPASVRLSAFHEVPDGYVLRLYGSSGEPTEVTVALPGSFTEAVWTDFNLEPLGGQVSLAGPTLRMALRPWEIATVLLKR